ncbi:MAG: UDP-2,3-diacylglucosamine diphosphatase, partial [Venatoribacter sp.]
FISDLHLQESHPLMAQGFYRYLENLNDAKALYILGDFFEVWIGDDYETPFINEVKAALKRLTERGVQVFFMHGNRDFALGDVFCQQTGVQLLADPAVIELGGEPILLMHGDSLCTMDAAYMKMRPMLRSPMMLKQLLSQSIEQRLAMANRLRGASKEGNAMKSEEIMDVTPEEVVKVMLEHGVTTMIHGHTHRPFDHIFKHEETQLRRIVLGDWSDSSGWQVRFDDETGFVLSQFSF